MASLAETAAQMGDQHLAYGGFVADDLHQLIDPILLKQVFGTLLLKREAGVEKSQLRPFAASRFGFPGQPSFILHGVKQCPHMAARAIQQLVQLV